VLHTKYVGNRPGKILEFLEWLGAMDPFAVHSTTSTFSDLRNEDQTASAATYRPSPTQYSDEEKSSIVFYLFNKRR